MVDARSELVVLPDFASSGRLIVGRNSAAALTPHGAGAQKVSSAFHPQPFISSSSSTSGYLPFVGGFGQASR
jgi:hypothetical protein